MTNSLDRPQGRGDFFRSAARLIAGFVAEQVEEALVRGPRPLRPPGALDELTFLAACTRCDRCMLACPQGSIISSPPGTGLSMGTPCIHPRALPCYLCEELPCVSACPEGALLQPRRRIGGEAVEGPRAVRMGLAVVDGSRCLAFPRGEEPALACRACMDRCPYPDEVLRMVLPEGGGVPRPVISEEACTGCGLCVFGCATPEPSIRVEPRG